MYIYCCYRPMSIPPPAQARPMMLCIYTSKRRNATWIAVNLASPYQGIRSESEKVRQDHVILDGPSFCNTGLITFTPFHVPCHMTHRGGEARVPAQCKWHRRIKCSSLFKVEKKRNISAPVLPVNVSRPYFSTRPQGARKKFCVWGRD